MFTFQQYLFLNRRLNIPFFSQVKELYAANQLSQLDKLIGVLRELALAPNGQTRKGGLIGLAAAAIALGKVCDDITKLRIRKRGLLFCSPKRWLNMCDSYCTNDCN